MGRKRKKLIAAAAAVCALAAVAVFAYLTDNDDKDNRIKIGYNESRIVEDFTPFTMQTGINIYKKKVQVENTGNTPCFARVYVDFSDDDIRKNSFLSYIGGESDESAIDGMLENGHAIFTWDDTNSEYVLNKGKTGTTLSGLEAKFDFYSALHKLSVTEGENTELLALKTNAKGTHDCLKVESDAVDTKTYAEAVNTVTDVAPGWVYIENEDPLSGYYYYTEPLDPGEATPPLFSYITTVMGTDIKAFDIQVYSESVQTVDSSGTDRANAADGYKTVWNDFLSKGTP